MKPRPYPSPKTILRALEAKQAEAIRKAKRLQGEQGAEYFESVGAIAALGGFIDMISYRRQTL
jgi:hypothetical protein